MHELIAFLTEEPEAANAFAAIASAVTAFIALIVSAIALYVAHATLKHQRVHNVLSLRPIPFVLVGDYENRLVVYLTNHGSGPLVVTQLSAHNNERTESSLIDWMPELPTGLHWTDFVESVSERAILPGDCITLLEFSGDDNDPAFSKVRDAIRLLLASLFVSVDYTDVYQTKFATYSRPLDFFGRHSEVAITKVPNPAVRGTLRNKGAQRPLP